uniref:Uncharacterized protein n=1 Tax=Molossus molossus TaxID=27622 RepID=A0A7J8I0N7_MOLMO|nr:hypothetical protein HJG59_010750 [Molossus molossus]
MGSHSIPPGNTFLCFGEAGCQSGRPALPWWARARSLPARRSTHVLGRLPRCARTGTSPALRTRSDVFRAAHALGRLPRWHAVGRLPRRARARTSSALRTCSDVSRTRAWTSSALRTHSDVSCAGTHSDASRAAHALGRLPRCARSRTSPALRTF